VKKSPHNRTPGHSCELGFANVDLSREKRCGIPEVIYCPGKTTEQIIRIMKAILRTSPEVMATRSTPEQFRRVHRAIPAAAYNAHARIITVSRPKRAKPAGLVVVVSAGTSDIPVAEEAAFTASYMGARVERVFDVGVAGLHRLMKHLDLIRSASAVVIVAGMEGALPSVIGGLIDKPIIAVPTSTGYGTGVNGYAAMLAMLNSCVPGITVVNIDNGFGAGVAAARINRITAGK
jgi:pyridinium-3,5-biscarboxylic acid mononucleotide synthase